MAEVPITITPIPPPSLNCPVNPQADYFLRTIAGHFDESPLRVSFLCLSYSLTTEGSMFEYRVALRAAHLMTAFLSAGGGGGGSVGGIAVDPGIVKSYKEGDIQIVYRDNVSGQVVLPDGYSDPYMRELSEIEDTALAKGIVVNIIN